MKDMLQELRTQSPVFLMLHTLFFSAYFFWVYALFDFLLGGQYSGMSGFYQLLSYGFGAIFFPLLYFLTLLGYMASCKVKMQRLHKIFLALVWLPAPIAIIIIFFAMF